MTHSTLSFQVLRSMTTTELKAHAKKIGATPDCHGRIGWIEAIEETQSIVQLVVDFPLSYDDLAELGLIHAPTVGSVAGQSGYAELELSEAVQSALLKELNVIVNQLDPEDGEGVFEITKDGNYIVNVDGRDNAYTLHSWMFYGTTYSSPEAAAIAWLEIHCPSEVLLALAVAQQGILDRSSLPDYM